MDDRTNELIAVGASVAGHCQPCLNYHVRKAKEIGIDDQAIRDAIAIGRMVEKGAVSAMRKFSESVFDAVPQEAPCCCAGEHDSDQESCCT